MSRVVAASSDPTFAGWMGFCAGGILVGVLGLMAVAAAKTDAIEHGRCIGWAEARGLTPAWDDEGRCVLGAHPAEEAP